MRKTSLLSMAWVVIGIAVVISVSGCGKPTRSGLEGDARQAGEKIQYELKLREGISYDVRVVTEENTVSDDGKRKYSSQRIIGFEYRFDVSSIDDDGNAIVDCKVTRVKFKQKVVGGIPANQDVDYDSSDEKRQTIRVGEGMEDLAFSYARFIRAFLDEKFTVLMTPRGEVKAVMELDTFCKNIAGKLGDSRRGFQNMADEQLTFLLKRLLLQSPAFFPEQPVGVGDSWTATEIFPLEHENTLTLKRRKGGIATIEVDADFMIPSPGKEGGRSEKSGQITINESTGQILACKVNLEMPSQGGKANTVTTFEMTKPKGGPL